MPQVGFDNTFFARSLNDYSNWVFSFIRESMQNSIDCGSDLIEYSISHDDTHVTVVFHNNGSSMDYDTLVNKLMNVGGTTKTTGSGQVGGFGVAKIVLYMSHESYKIRSGGWTITGNGGNYDICETQTFNGTQSTVTIKSEDPKSLAEKLRGQLLRFAGFLQWRGSLYVSYNRGQYELINTSLRKGSFRREFGFGKLYTNKSYNGLLIFRINGIPMFTKHISFPGCAIFEATQNSVDLMTSNRDGLKWMYQSEIEDVIERFSTNRASVLNPEPIVEIFGNVLLSVSEEPVEDTSDDEPADDEPVEDTSDDEPADDTSGDGYIPPKQSSGSSGCYNNTNEPQKNDEKSETGLYIAARQNSGGSGDRRQENARRPTNIGYSRRFMIFNETGMTTPTHAMPGLMSEYCKKLVDVWSNLMCEVHKINEMHKTFAVGFCLGDSIAKCLTKDDVTYYLINPFKIVEQDSSKSRSFKKRYNFSKDKEDLIMSAVHEFIHGAYGNNYSYHDEDFAAKLTTLAGIALKNRKQLIRAFRTNEK